MLEVYKFTVFTAPCEVQLYTNNKQSADSCAKSILAEMKRLEKKYNYFDTSSYLSTLNTRQDNTLDEETKTLLSLSKQYYKKTNTIFDITIATIKNIFDENKKNETLEYVGCEHFEIKKNKLYFDNDFTKLDLGGVVKEYGVDKAVKIIKKHKIKSALVNFGGDIYALGRKPDGKKFKIGIKNPIDRTKTHISIELENEALTTSASYERFTEIDGVQHSHIRSKTQDQNEIMSSTVISKTTMESGIFSTAFMIDKNLQTKNKKYLITKDLEIIS